MTGVDPGAAAELICSRVFGNAVATVPMAFAPFTWATDHALIAQKGRGT